MEGKLLWYNSVVLKTIGAFGMGIVLSALRDN